MSDIQIGLSKSARRTFALDDVALVPTRRTRDRRDVDRLMLSGLTPPLWGHPWTR